jgi:hypothetical protein
MYVTYTYIYIHIDYIHIYIIYLYTYLFIKKKERPLVLGHFGRRCVAVVARRPLLTRVVRSGRLRAIAEDCLQVVRASMHACVWLHQLAAGRSAQRADALAH